MYDKHIKDLYISVNFCYEMIFVVLCKRKQNLIFVVLCKRKQNQWSTWDLKKYRFRALVLFLVQSTIKIIS